MQEVTVLVAAYNSEKYIEALLRSLLAQTHGGLDIVLRDDGSSDETLSIAKKVSDADGRVRILEKEGKGPSAKTNFSALLSGTDGDYTMFCDADDVWQRDKVEKTLSLMLKTEAEHAGVPVLVHTDLTVSEEDLGVIAPSLFGYEKLSPERKSFKNLLAQNNVTGCTVMINRRLRETAGEIPDDAVMHDWWLALIAAALGEIAVLYEPTILYRQHGKNQIGAYDAGSLRSALRKVRAKETNRAVYSAMFRQAGCFADSYKDLISEQQYEDAKRYSEMASLSKLGKIFRIIRRGYYKNTFVRNVGQFLVI